MQFLLFWNKFFSETGYCTAEKAPFLWYIININFNLAIINWFKVSHKTVAFARDTDSIYEETNPDIAAWFLSYEALFG